MKKFLKNLEKQKWQYLMILSIVLLGIWLVYIGFLFYKKYTLQAQISKYNTQVSQLNSEIVKIKSDENVRKYLLVKEIYKNLKPTKWSYVMQQMYNILQNIHNVAKDRFVINNFYINMDQLQFVGKVGDLKDVYSPGGIIDQFEALPFIKHMKIPYYKRADNMFEFSLNAKIDINEHSTK